MTDKAWKQRERQVMAWLGSTRKPVSGRQRDKDGDDGEHPLFHVQQKHSKRHALLNVWDAAKRQCLKSKKTPIVTLSSPHRPGFWVLIKEEDVPSLIAWFMEPLTDSLKVKAVQAMDRYAALRTQFENYTEGER